MRTVFISSTSEDLKPFRQAAKDVILDLGWHPVMMEHFGTDGSVGIVEACKQRVAAADLVLAILGWRLGWVPKPEVGGDGKRSITQIEIDAAKSLDKPVLFLLADDRWPGNLWESKTEAREQMEAARKGIDRLAVFFQWEPLESGAVETLPQFRSKVRQELMRLGETGTSARMTSGPHHTPRYPNEEIRRLSEALEEAHHREETILIEGGDAAAIRAEILDLRRKIREGGNVKAGDVLSGRFRLLDLLGDGGFATVWKAFDRQERRLVAVKVLHPQVARDGSRLDRFVRGARKMAELSHPGIVRVLEKSLEDGGYHYFVMEYVEGGDLRAAVLEKRLLPDRIVPLIREVAVALQFFHDQGEGYVHRDIKPANILLDPHGHPKLTDFDLVRAATDTTGGTKAGSMLGTFLYTAPECMGLAQDAGVTADVYSLAMTAAFCFYGKDLPFSVLRNPESFVDQLSCPPDVRQALRQGVAWDASKRFRSVASLTEAMNKEDPKPRVDENLAEALPKAIKHVGLTTPTQPKWSKYRFLMLASACITLLYMGVILLWLPPTEQQRVFENSTLGSQALVWFSKAGSSPSSRVSDAARRKMLNWSNSLARGQLLNPTETNSARIALFELVYACWWDQKHTSTNWTKTDPPLVDLTGFEIPRDDLKLIWEATATDLTGSAPYPAHLSTSDPEFQWLFVRRWLSNSLPCKPAKVPSTDSWRLLLETRKEEIASMFLQTASSKLPIAPKMRARFFYWAVTDTSKFNKNDLRESLAASFEYVYKWWHLYTRQSGNLMVDGNMSSIKWPDILQLCRSLEVQLPDVGNASDPDIQVLIVRAWLDKKKNAFKI
jgi:serine/threonine protein kinase